MRVIKDVYWPEKMKVYFEHTIRVTPAQFRNVASGNLVRDIEDKARERNSNEVSEEDLVGAFLDSIPVFFRPDMIKLLKDLGISVAERSKKEKKIDINSLRADIKSAADLVDVSCKDQILDSILKAFEVSLTSYRTCISLSTSTKRVEHRGLSVQFIDLFNKVNPYKKAVEEHMLPYNDLPMEHFMEECSVGNPIIGYLVQFGVTTGIEKIVMMCASYLPQSMEQTSKLKSAPDSIRANLPILEKNELKYGVMYGVNYLKNLIMVHFMTKQINNFGVEYIENMLSDFNFKVPQRSIIELCKNSVMITMNFSYVNNQPDTISFLSCIDGTGSLPKNLNSVVYDFTDNVPSKQKVVKFILSVVFTKNSQSLEIQSDYLGSITDRMGGPLNQFDYNKN